MSIESVKTKCIELNPRVNCSKLDKSILSAMERFEKIAQTQLRDYIPISRFKIMAKENQTPWQAQSEYFEEHKLESIHLYLKLICDLYDYKSE